MSIMDNPVIHNLYPVQTLGVIAGQSMYSTLYAMQ